MSEGSTTGALKIYDRDGDLSLGHMRRALQEKKGDTLWQLDGEEFYVGANMPLPPEVDRLPAGMYEFRTRRPFGLYFKPVPMIGDELVRWEGSPVEYVTKNIEIFWSKEEHYKQLGATWKRGILLYGPPGTGKTSIVRMLAQDVTKRDGVVFSSRHLGILDAGIQLFRSVEPKRPLVVVLEDIEQYSNRRETSSHLLKMLDGEVQYENIVYVATTNFIDRIDPRIANRPSRFDVVQEIGFPPETDRAGFLLSKHPKRFMGNQSELDLWVSLTEGFTAAHLKELIFSVEVYETTVEEAVDRLRKMIEAVSLKFEDSPDEDLDVGTDEGEDF